MYAILSSFHSLLFLLFFFCFFFFFFKQKTAYEIGLGIPAEPLFRSQMLRDFLGTINPDTNKIPKHLFQGYLNIYNNYFKAPRSEERRVGKECRSRWWTYH